MKYVNSNINYSRFAVIAGLALSVLLFLNGCAGSSSKQNVSTAVDVAPELIETTGFLPRDQFDKEGQKLPYQIAPNQYAEQTGRVSKQAVASYIDARRAYKSGDFDKAVTLLTALTAEEKNLSGPLVMLGDIANERANSAEALDFYRRAIQVNKQNINAHLRLGALYRKQGEFVLAQNSYATALNYWPDFPEAHLNLGILYDVYLNLPLKAQQHMEAYQFLTQGKDSQIDAWLVELRERTGVNYSIKAGVASAAPLTQVGAAGGTP
ncbi:tetratricopeptide repeat protein [Teredinibacter waterburyi]|uniref:tetratricopeptide repeat protein n=1 Tax=Teredinibacter waterburyi TaxID=1500538 RepID=UPI001FE2C0C8|nr:tetratricopeptide repeat protein [Teredinibacter waterburyi]